MEARQENASVNARISGDLFSPTPTGEDPNSAHMVVVALVAVILPAKFDA
jgi:hypothetical protein